MTFSLGAFNFWSCGSPGDHSVGPALLQENGIVLTRPNVPGAGIVQYGIQAGDAFEFESQVDQLTRADAITLHGLYRLVTNNTLMRLVWQDVDFDALNQRFLVRKVHPPKIHRPALTCGGIVANSTVWLTTRWTLQAMPLT